MDRKWCRVLVMGVALVMVLAAAGCASAPRAEVARLSARMHDTQLRRIASTAELDGLVRDARQLRALHGVPASPWAVPVSTPVSSSPSSTGEATELDSIVVTGSLIRSPDQITNNQEAGVDEGDIVKKSGDFLVVLRRGVLHTLRIARDGAPVLEQADQLVVAVDDSGEDAWYDEILTYGSRLVLLGYNYGADDEVAELLVFDLDAAGRIHRRGRYWLRGEDYFSGDNYGARIQGDNLLISLSMELWSHEQMTWPEWSRRDGAASAWQSLIDVEQLYFPLYTTADPHVHVVLQCPMADLGGVGLKCRTTGLIGESDAVLYATPEAAFVALPAWDEAAFAQLGFDNDWPSDELLMRPFQQTAVYRVPFAAGETPTFARVRGSVGNQFQFKADGGGLYLATRSGSREQRDLLLSHVEPMRFQPQAGPVIEPTTTLSGGRYDTIRFSDRALWAGPSWRWHDRQGYSDVIVQPLAGGPPTLLRMKHSADALQPAFGGMMVSGGASRSADEEWPLWRISFARDLPYPRAASTVDVAEYVASESRSHAMNFAVLGDGTQLFGMPGAPRSVVDKPEWSGDVVSDLVFMRLLGDQLGLAGAVDMQGPQAPESCDASCTDWYGNARLFFLGDRILALSADRMKEVRYRTGGLQEVRSIRLP